MSEPIVRMDNGGAVWASLDDFARQLAAFLNANGISTNAAKNAYIDGLTATQLQTATRLLLKALIHVKP